MARLQNVRHEKFCQLMAVGMSASEAYRKAGYTNRNTNVLGSRLMANVSVSNRINELRESADKKTMLSKEQVMKFLADVIATPAGKVDGDNPLCQGIKQTARSSEVRIPDKIKAAERLAKMCGWDSAEKIEHGAADSLTALMARIRGGK